MHPTVENLKKRIFARDIVSSICLEWKSSLNLRKKYQFLLLCLIRKQKSSYRNAE